MSGRSDVQDIAAGDRSITESVCAAFARVSELNSRPRTRAPAPRWLWPVERARTPTPFRRPLAGDHERRWCPGQSSQRASRLRYGF
jgi:hypothetical protein